MHAQDFSSCKILQSGNGRSFFSQKIGFWPSTCPHGSSALSSCHDRMGPSDDARHFLNRCHIYMVAKAVHENWSNNHCNQSVHAVVYTAATSVLENTRLPSLFRTHTHTISHCAAFYVCCFSNWSNKIQLTNC